MIHIKKRGDARLNKELSDTFPNNCPMRPQRKVHPRFWEAARIDFGSLKLFSVEMCNKALITSKSEFDAICAFRKTLRYNLFCWSWNQPNKPGVWYKSTRLLKPC